jgi:hypothetical protein
MSKEEILDVFDYWNLYKDEPGWWGHRKLTCEMEHIINEVLETHSLIDICISIDNYAAVLLNSKYWWDYKWPLYTFFNVKNSKKKGSSYKWWQFLPDNFVLDNYLHKKNNICVLGADLNLANNILEMYRKLINNSSYNPDEDEYKKFMLTSKKMIDFFKNKNILKDNWIKHFRLCLENNIVNKGNVVYVGHLCSDTTWNIMFPQYLLELGV